MPFKPLPPDEHPAILACEFQAERHDLTDMEAMLMGCLVNVLNEMPEWLDGAPEPGTALWHANEALNAIRNGRYLSISKDVRQQAAMLRGDDGGSN